MRGFYCPGLLGLHITDGTETQGYVSQDDRRTILKASMPLLAAMLSCAALGETTCNLSTKAQSLVESKRSSPPAPVLVSQTHQQRSDRVVGYWTSSSGADVDLAYTGKPESLWIQVYFKPGQSDPHRDYTAKWLTNDRFTYTDLSGSRVEGRVSASGSIINLEGADGWRGTWRRKR